MIVSITATTSLLTEYFNITAVGALTDITPLNIGKRPVTIASVRVTETAGGTPNLTIIAFDPKGATASYYRRNAKPMSAKEEYIDQEPFVLLIGWKLLAQVSTGTASVFVDYLTPNAAATSS